MGYDLRLVKDGEIAQLPCKVMLGGSVYPIDGTDIAEYATTYNYSELFREAFGNQEGLYTIQGKTAAESIDLLESAIDKLSDENNPPTVKELKAQIKAWGKELNKMRKGKDRSPVFEGLLQSYIKDYEDRLRTADPETGRVQLSYWDATPGNAKKALQELLILAKLADKDSVWEIS